ncbi:MAG: hypothetical protein U1U88_000908 [Lawsonella clevelandensis]
MPLRWQKGMNFYDEQVTASGPHRDRFNLRSYFAEPAIDRAIHPVDPWRWVETAPPTSDLGVAESLFTVGNGYLGVRGNPEEGRDSALNGTYVNGLHETWDIQHAEDAYGLARVDNPSSTRRMLRPSVFMWMTDRCACLWRTSLL